MYIIIQRKHIQNPESIFGIIQQFNNVSKSSVTLCPSPQPLPNPASFKKGLCLWLQDDYISS